MRHHPVIAFVVPYPFEILDLTGPVSVFERAQVTESATIQSESCPPDQTVLSRQKAEWSSATPASTLTM